MLTHLEYLLYYKTVFEQQAVACILVRSNACSKSAKKDGKQRTNNAICFSEEGEVPNSMHYTHYMSAARHNIIRFKQTL